MILLTETPTTTPFVDIAFIIAIFFVFLCIGAATLSCVVIFADIRIKRSSKHNDGKKEKDIDFDEYSKIILEVNDDKTSYQKINDLVDVIIDDAIETYLELNIRDGKVYDKEDYFDSEYIKEMHQYVTLTVKRHMTEYIINILKLYNDFDNESIGYTLDDYLNLRIKLKMVKVVAVNNVSI